MIGNLIDIDLGIPSVFQKKGPPPVPRKHWLKSRTLWINTVAAVMLAAEASLHLIQPIVGEKFYLLTSFALVLINVILRTLTTVAIGGDDAE